MDTVDGVSSPFMEFVTRRLLCPFLAVVLFSLTGCSKIKDVDQAGAHQSLVEIGERSLELAESKEGAGNYGEANASYRRALWAFNYHQHLTGEEPLLMEEAEDGVRRTSRKD